MKAIRILSLILALLLLAIPLVACDDTTDEPTTDEPETEESTELQIVKKGETKYVVVFDYMAGTKTRENVLILEKAFADYLGCEVEVVECFSDRDDPD